MSMRKRRRGLYANIQAKRRRIARGSGEHMRRAGEKGAPARGAFRKAAKTARPKRRTRRSGRR